MGWTRLLAHPTVGGDRNTPRRKSQKRYAIKSELGLRRIEKPLILSSVQKFTVH
jgi:hypothetical protein